jgi:hypothetical protein
MDKKHGVYCIGDWIMRTNGELQQVLFGHMLGIQMKHIERHATPEEIEEKLNPAKK